MAGETVITVIGNLTSDPELRFTSSGVSVASFRVASTPRNFNRASGQWEEGTTLFMHCEAWQEMAENINETLRKGMRVIVSGRLVQESWTDKSSGESRSRLKLRVDEIGPSLRYAQASVTRNNRGNSGEGGYNSQGNNFSGNGGFSQESSFGDSSFGGPQGGSNDDPWASGNSFSSSFDDNPAY